MKEKGFTLVELLVVILIIALLGGIGLISYNAFFKTSKEKYYNALESSLLLAGNDYFLDHRSELPLESEYGEISIKNLVDNKYMEEVIDSKGNTCIGTVYVSRNDNKYNYEVCLTCSDYESKNRNNFCKEHEPADIMITAKTKNTNQDYNASVSYNEAVVQNENILVTIDIPSNKVEVSRYEIVNNKTKEVVPGCNELTGNMCTIEVEKSGTYHVIAYNRYNNMMSDEYFNVRIQKNEPEFTIRGETKYIISKEDCNSNKETARVEFTIEKGNEDDEYKQISYRINDGEFKTIKSLTISEELESGNYTLEVEIIDQANRISSQTYHFDVGYIVEIVYSDDNTIEQHEVVKGENYGYLSELPTTKTVAGDVFELELYKDDKKISSTDLVEGSCNDTINANIIKKELDVIVTPYSGDYDGNIHYATVKVASSAWDGKTIESGVDTSYDTTVTSDGVYNTSYDLKPGYDYTFGIRTVYYKISGGTYYNDKIGSTTVDAKRKYNLTYVDNIFAATRQLTNEVTVGYDEANSYLTLNGTGTAKEIIPTLWNLDRRTITAGDVYQITIKYISGTMKQTKNTSQVPRFVFELAKSGSRFDNRSTSPASYKIINLPKANADPITETYTVPDSRTGANGLNYWLHEQTAGNTTFTSYTVQIIITKVYSKDVIYGQEYGELATPKKNGYTFNGWYTDITEGTNKTSDTMNDIDSDQTLYAQYTSNKLYIQYYGYNNSSVKWCSTSSTLGADSSKYAIKKANDSRTISTVAYGQYVSYKSGLYDYHNTGSICFSRSGYTVESGKEWRLSSDSSIVYDQAKKTYTAQGIAKNAGCTLATTPSCTATMRVRWVAESSGGGGGGDDGGDTGCTWQQISGTGYFPNGSEPSTVSLGSSCPATSNGGVAYYGSVCAACPAGCEGYCSSIEGHMFGKAKCTCS